MALTPDGEHLTREYVLPGNSRRELTPEVKDEAVQLVIDTGRVVATVTRELCVVNADRKQDH